MMEAEFAILKEFSDLIAPLSLLLFPEQTKVVRLFQMNKQTTAKTSRFAAVLKDVNGEPQALNSVNCLDCTGDAALHHHVMCWGLPP